MPSGGGKVLSPLVSGFDVSFRKAAFDSARVVQGGKGLFGSRETSVLGEAHAEAGGHLIATGGSPSFISVTDRTCQLGVSKPPG